MEVHLRGIPEQNNSADGRLTEGLGEGGEITCVVLRVYAGSPERYATFVTLETYRAIWKYGHMWVDMMKCQPRPGGSRISDHQSATAPVIGAVHRQAGALDGGQSEAARSKQQERVEVSYPVDIQLPEILQQDVQGGLVRRRGDHADPRRVHDES